MFHKHWSDTDPSSASVIDLKSVCLSDGEHITGKLIDNKVGAPTEGPSGIDLPGTLVSPGIHRNEFDEEEGLIMFYVTAGGKTWTKIDNGTIMTKVEPTDEDDSMSCASHCGVSEPENCTNDLHCGDLKSNVDHVTNVDVLAALTKKTMDERMVWHDCRDSYPHEKERHVM